VEVIKRALFEEPLYLYISLGLAELIIAIIWYERRTGKLAVALVIPVVLAACVFAMDCLVVTDREEIIAASAEIARDLKAGSLGAAEKYLHEHFTGFHGTKQDALSEGRRALKQHNARLVQVADMELVLAGRHAEMYVTVVFQPGAGVLSGQRFSVRWLLRWVKVTEADKQVWRIGSATPVERPGR
jgi:hypothetical protein